MASDTDDKSDIYQLNTMRADLEQRLRVGGLNVPDPVITDKGPLPALTVDGALTCESLLSSASTFIFAAQDAAIQDPPDTYHMNQYLAIGSAYLDAWTGQCG